MKKMYDLSSLRWITHGAAPCAPAVKREMIDWWGPMINEYYGATETGIVVWHNSAEALKLIASKHRWVGVPSAAPWGPQGGSTFQQNGDYPAGCWRP